VNEGEFLFWSIEILLDYTNNCQLCKENENEAQTNNENTESMMDVESVESKEKSKSSKSKSKSQSVPASNSSHCDTCDECVEVLEQTFFCLFGYKKKTVRYLKNHSVINIKFTLDNCISLYEFYKPKLPEYDDLQKSSISVEVEFFY
jgi:hypothetical protein